MSDIHRLTTTFEHVYRDRIWSNGSGSGSDPENTASYREFIEGFIVQNRIRTVVDLGCGDWRSSRLIDWGGARYSGFDVVESVIERNRHLYQTARVRFQCMHDEAELTSADLLIVKDVLQHLPNSDIHYISRYLGRYTYSLITNTVTSELRWPNGTQLRIADVNSDVIAGRMRPVNVLIEPFKWPGYEVHRYIVPWPGVGAWETKSTVLVSVAQ